MQNWYMATKYSMYQKYLFLTQNWYMVTKYSMYQNTGFLGEIGTW